MLDEKDELRFLIQEELTKFFNGACPSDENKLLSRAEAAKILGIKRQTLALWASKGIGPAETKIGTRSMYSRSALDDYIAKQTVIR